MGGRDRGLDTDGEISSRDRGKETERGTGNMAEGKIRTAAGRR